MGAHGFEQVPELLGATSRSLLVRWLPADSEFDWSAAGDLLGRMHRLDASRSELKYSTDPLPLGERLVSTAARASSRVQDPDLRRLAELAVEELQKGASAITNERRLIHRDLRPPNWLAHHGASLVDFEHAACANPAWDFVKLNWWTLGEDRQPFFEAYRHHHALPDPDEVRLFSLYESASMLGFFETRNAEYVATAIHCINELLH